jgi:SAM-dependent methyltransferase
MTYSVAHSSEPYPQNASTIYYAPNHVRAYRRSVYEQVGGHDDTFKVCDDQDLCSRMYQVADFYHINRCLYFQRMHKFNTQRDTETNAAIQNINAALYERDVQANALAWAHRRQLSCFDLGSGPGGPPTGYLGVDLHDYGVENVVVGDIFEEFDKMPDQSVGVIRAVDFLEHIPPSRVVELMNLMWRKLAHGGFLFSMTPSTDGRGAFCDPTHISFFNELSFHYYAMQHKAQYVPEIECRFNISRLVTVPHVQPDDIPYVQANLVAIHDGPRQYGLTFW